MDLKITVSKELNQLDQVVAQTGIPLQEGEWIFPPSLGKGSIRMMEFPAWVNLYFYEYELHQAVALKSENPEDSGLFIINVNLSEAVVAKTLDNREVEINATLPSGLFCYSPGVNGHGNAEPGKPYQVAIISFAPEAFEPYIENKDDPLHQLLNGGQKFCLFEELDAQSGKVLKYLLQARPKSALERMQAHLQLMEVMHRVLSRLASRNSQSRYETVHEKDLEALFFIRNILYQSVGQDKAPSIYDLSRKAGMSESKLKRRFKQFFGMSLYQYFLHARMQKARNLLSSGAYSVSEVGHLIGYSNLSHFSKAFKNQFDLLPKEVIASLRI